MNFGQNLNPGVICQLYDFDFTTAGTIPSGWTTNHIYMSPTQTNVGVDLAYNGITYKYGIAQFSGLVLEMSGRIPSPTLKVVGQTEDASTQSLFKFINTGGDFRGVTVTRIRIPLVNLDGQSAASTDPKYTKVQKFVINQMTDKFRHSMTFVLSPARGLDSLNSTTNRVLSTNRCNLLYRVWDVSSSTYKYTPVVDGGCPFANPSENITDYPNCGSSWSTTHYDANDAVTTNPANDRCSLSTAGCLKRFPNTGASTDVFPISINLKGGSTS